MPSHVAQQLPQRPLPLRSSLLLSLLLITFLTTTRDGAAFSFDGRTLPITHYNGAPPYTFTRTSASGSADLTSINMSSSASSSPAAATAGGGGDLPPALLAQLADQANAFAAANGLQVETREIVQAGSGSSSAASSPASASSYYQCAPISLLPNVFPRRAFDAAKSVAPHFNLLVDRISLDGEFLNRTLGGEGGTASADPNFTGRMLDMYNEIYFPSQCGKSEDHGRHARSADRLGVLRSDYMLNPSASSPSGSGGTTASYDLKQVELNTVASSFAGLACQVANLHRFLLGRFAGDDLTGWIDSARVAVFGTTTPDGGGGGGENGVPTNPALDRLPGAMAHAHAHYTDRFSPTRPTTILFVVQDDETNTVDQRMIEFALYTNHGGVPVVRMSLTTAYEALQLDEESGALTIRAEYDDVNLEREISVVYYRAGYAPTDYPSPDDVEWTARERIERSRSTKCPNLGYHLAGTKKVQQELARPGVLERFGFGHDGVMMMRGAFAGLYSLGGDATELDRRAVREALGGDGGEGKFVLKPQREGGGYNYYGEQLRAKLGDNVDLSSSSSDGGGGEVVLDPALAEFILMERLFPPRQRATLLRRGRVEGTGDSVSELGCFGTILVDGSGGSGGDTAGAAAAVVLRNEFAGFLLRTKFSDVDEGGVASGFATLSSPYLC